MPRIPPAQTDETQQPRSSEKNEQLANDSRIPQPGVQGVDVVVFDDISNDVDVEIKKQEKLSNKDKFKMIMDVAKETVERNPNALSDYVRLLGRKLQSDYMCKVLTAPESDREPRLEPELVWFDRKAQITEYGACLDDLLVQSNRPVRLKLWADIILPCPWEKDRLVNAIANIGPNKELGDWKQDINHSAEYWLPFDIGWVNGGNHSIMSGIVQGIGMLEPEFIFDVSPVFSHVYCDGKAFYRKFDGEPIAEVTDLEFAAIFEVGRIMHDLKI